MYDIIIIGGGPAGLTAAVYARRANKTVLVIEKSTFGGQITYSPNVENIPGFLSISGNDFAEKLTDQVLELGADVEISDVVSVRHNSTDYFTVLTEDGEYSSKTVILSTGAKHRVLNLNNEKRFLGNGISFCAVCDGAFYKNKDVVVVGGGNSALQEALLLSEVVNNVTIIQNLPQLTGESLLCEKVMSKENISVIFNCTVLDYLGESELNGLLIKSNMTQNVSEIKCSGIFLAIGLEPQNDNFSDLVCLDNSGYIITTDDCKTNIEGVFAAGDCRKKSVRQVVTATSDGAVAALSACNFLDK